MNKNSLKLSVILLFAFGACHKIKKGSRNTYCQYANGMYVGSGAFKITIKDTLIDGEVKTDSIAQLYIIDSNRVNGKPVYDSVRKTWLQIRLGNPADWKFIKEIPEIFIDQTQ